MREGGRTLDGRGGGQIGRAESTGHVSECVQPIINRHRGADAAEGTERASCSR